MRFLFHIARGLLRPATTTPTKQQQLDLLTAHSFRSRAGIFDIDINLHLNNASLILQTEFARWNWMAQTGLLSHALRNRWIFLVASQSVRYRYEVAAFERMEIKTTVAAVDDEWIWIRHCVWSRNKLCAQSLVRVKIKHGKRTLPPLEFFDSAATGGGQVVSLLPSPEDSAEIQAFLRWDAESAVLMKQLQEESHNKQG